MSWYATKKASKLPSLDKRKILVFDTETTGLEPAVDEILQITILDGYGRTLFDSYIRPKHHKSWKAAEAVNHISYQMVKDMPSFSEVRSRIQDLFNKASLVVGYNVNFDINFVQAAGIVVSGQVFDVMAAFASYRAGVDKTLYRRCKLRECAEYFGHCYSPHDSSEDASVTLSCFNSLISDSRFTTYKAKEKKRVKESFPDDKPNHRTTFSFQLPAHRRHSMAFYGILPTIIAEMVLWFTKRTVVTDFMQYFSWIRDLPSNWNADRLEGVLYILIGIGCLFIAIGIIRFFISIPRIVAAKGMHFINRFR